MQEKSTDTHPLSDLAYDWITLMQNKAQALMAYDQYIKDAEQAARRNAPPSSARYTTATRPSSPKRRGT